MVKVNYDLASNQSINKASNFNSILMLRAIKEDLYIKYCILE